MVNYATKVSASHHIVKPIIDATVRKLDDHERWNRLKVKVVECDDQWREWRDLNNGRIVDAWLLSTIANPVLTPAPVMQPTEPMVSPTGRPGEWIAHPPAGALLVMFHHIDRTVEIVILQCEDRNEVISVAKDVALQLDAAAPKRCADILKDAYGVTASIVSAVIEVEVKNALQKEAEATAQ